jgi:thiosulfate reductase cytochrome b subunit
MGETYPSGARDEDESESERLTRNLNELLQELRVTQTGVQILTGFLLTLPFTNRFASLDDVQRYAYLGVLAGSVLATGLIIAPVAFHRVLFRHGQRPWLVNAANRAARAGHAALALTTSGMVWLVFDLVVDRTWASVAGVLSLLFFTMLWVVVPLRAPRSEEPTG